MFFSGNASLSPGMIGRSGKKREKKLSAGGLMNDHQTDEHTGQNNIFKIKSSATCHGRGMITIISAWKFNLSFAR